MSFFCLVSSLTVLSCLSLGMYDAHSCDVHIFISSHDRSSTLCSSCTHIRRSTILGFWNSLPGVAFFQCYPPPPHLTKKKKQPQTSLGFGFAPSPQRPLGFHTTAREPKRAHLRGHGLQKNTTKIQREDPQREKERKWEREEILRVRRRGGLAEGSGRGQGVRPVGGPAHGGSGGGNEKKKSKNLSI